MFNSKNNLNNNSNSKVKPAIEEILTIIYGWRIWAILAWQDIVLRYRRSTLGPFWITLSMAIRIYFMGFLYGHLFKLDLAVYFPYLASGIIIWTTIANLVNETTLVFIESESYLRNIKMSYTHLIMRSILRNIIIFLHNLLAFIPILIYYSDNIINFSWFNMLLFIPNLIILVINCIFIGSVLAILGTRFRDLQIIVDSIIQVIFFCTPIMWMPSLLPEKYLWLVELNPFYHIISLLRHPMMGQPVDLLTYKILGFITMFSFSFYYYFMNRCKYRVIFWL